MFFKTLRKQINDLSNEVKYLKENKEILTNRLEALEEEKTTIQRILHNHSHGEIVGHFVPKGAFYGTALYCLFLYKDGKEYFFEHLLKISNPVFTQGETESIVYVESGDKKRKYVLDLRAGTSILIKTGEKQNGEVEEEQWLH